MACFLVASEMKIPEIIVIGSDQSIHISSEVTGDLSSLPINVANLVVSMRDCSIFEEFTKYNEALLNGCDLLSVWLFFLFELFSVNLLSSFLAPNLGTFLNQ